MTLTVFIGTFNRLETLERSVRSYERFSTPHELVIVDNGSDDQRCIDKLAELEKLPYVRKVYSFPGVEDMYGATDHFLTAMKDTPKGDNDWFAVSEADVCFDGADPRTLAVYIALAKRTGEAAGSHLRVDGDIPRGYPLRSRVISCESRLLYRDTFKWLGKIPYNSWQIDTTFHLFPAHRKFKRLHMNPWRVGPPFDAMHLDWYLNIFEPNVENSIYIVNAKNQVGSWGRQWLADYWNTFQEHGAEIAFEHLVDAPLNDHGDLCINSFMLSWAHQYGVGTEADEAKSLEWLHRAIPSERFAEYWVHEEDWPKMLFENDFSCLGWET